MSMTTMTTTTKFKLTALLVLASALLSTPASLASPLRSRKGMAAQPANALPATGLLQPLAPELPLLPIPSDDATHVRGTDLDREPDHPPANGRLPLRESLPSDPEEGGAVPSRPALPTE